MREIWTRPVDGAEIGLSGAKQVFQIQQTIDYLRRGKVYKTTQETRWAVTSLDSEQAGTTVLLGLVRGYWAIEIKQHYRRDHTQREDHCQVRNTRTARNLCLMRSAAIFLYERQRKFPKGKKSLPDWQRKNLRNPNPLISMLAELAA